MPNDNAIEGAALPPGKVSAINPENNDAPPSLYQTGNQFRSGTQRRDYNRTRCANLP
jgi:hypothetical protein